MSIFDTIFDAIDTPIIAWTIFVFWAGYMIGRLRGRAGSIAPIARDRISGTARARIEQALSEGRQIDAIRLVRDDTGSGLAEARATILAWRNPA